MGEGWDEGEIVGLKSTVVVALILSTAMLLIAACSPTPRATPTPLPSATIPQITAEPAFPNLPPNTFGNRPVFLTYPPDDTNRIVVIEQDGKILIFENSVETAEANTFLNLSDRIARNGNEEGLLGLAFHPLYSSNGHFYVYYSASSPRRSVISQFTVSDDPNTADPASEKIILEVPQPHANHNGGMLAFGNDGYLYVGIGDGGSRGDPSENGQNITTLLGSIIRIAPHPSAGDLSYGIPPDNPFADSTNGPNDPRPEIWAYGLRNPWRFSFDRATNELWLGDVGQSAWEEIDVIEKGGNYGWNTLEATHCFNPSTGCDSTDTIPPVAEYANAGGNCSVTGGYVYRGPEYPGLAGVYIFADFCSGELWGVRTNDRPASKTAQQIGSINQQIPSFGEDKAGNLYMLSFNAPPWRITLAE